MMRYVFSGESLWDIEVNSWRGVNTYEGGTETCDAGAEDNDVGFQVCLSRGLGRHGLKWLG